MTTRLALSFQVHGAVLGMFGVMMMGGVVISRAHNLAPVYLERSLPDLFPWDGWMDGCITRSGFEFALGLADDPNTSTEREMEEFKNGVACDIMAGCNLWF